MPLGCIRVAHCYGLLGVVILPKLVTQGFCVFMPLRWSCGVQVWEVTDRPALRVFRVLEHFKKWYGLKEAQKTQKQLIFVFYVPYCVSTFFENALADCFCVSRFSPALLLPTSNIRHARAQMGGDNPGGIFLDTLNSLEGG
jgi:hypothetical protein